MTFLSQENKKIALECSRAILYFNQHFGLTNISIKPIILIYADLPAYEAGMMEYCLMYD